MFLGSKSRFKVSSKLFFFNNRLCSQVLGSSSRFRWFQFKILFLVSGFRTRGFPVLSCFSILMMPSGQIPFFPAVPSSYFDLQAQMVGRIGQFSFHYGNIQWGNFLFYTGNVPWANHLSTLIMPTRQTCLLFLSMCSIYLICRSSGGRIRQFPFLYGNSQGAKFLFIFYDIRRADFLFFHRSV